MKLIWAITLLECSNLNPGNCKARIISPVGTELQCKNLLATTDYWVNNRTQGTFLRPECREYPVTQRWGRQ